MFDDDQPFAGMLVDCFLGRRFFNRRFSRRFLDDFVDYLGNRCVINGFICGFICVHLRHLPIKQRYHAPVCEYSFWVPAAWASALYMTSQNSPTSTKSPWPTS